MAKKTEAKSQKTAAVMVSIFINEGDQWRGHPLHLELLQALAKEGIAGATVIRAVAGYTGRVGIN